MRRRTMWLALMLLPASCVGSGQEAEPVPALAPEHFAWARPAETGSATAPAPGGAPTAPSAQEPAGLAAPVLVDAGAGPGQLIDLASALQLAGAGSLQIEFARQRVAEAQARQSGADVLWLPDIFVGASYESHGGVEQSTPGIIVTADKNATFLGGGLVASFELADVIFEPGVAGGELRAQESALIGMVNDVLLQVAIAYEDLAEAQYELAVAREAVANTEELTGLAESFALTGEGLEADAARVRSYLFRRMRVEAAAEEQVAIRSAWLATLLRLDPTVRLRAAESGLVPVTLIPEEIQVEVLVQQAQLSRPEVEQLIAVVDAAERREDQERLRPLIPNLLVGVSGGALAGGTTSSSRGFDDSSDFQIGVVWSLDNRASAQGRGAQYRQARVALARLRDQISGEVTIAYQEVHNKRRQMDLASESVGEAQRSLELNLARIRAAEGLPIEVLQAIQAAASASGSYVEATMNYNRAQLRLLRSVGRPVEAG